MNKLQKIYHLRGNQNEIFFEEELRNHSTKIKQNLKTESEAKVSIL